MKLTVLSSLGMGCETQVASNLTQGHMGTEEEEVKRPRTDEGA
jgi:hypothetical protein